MKKFLLLSVLTFCFGFLSAQTIFKDYTDGKIYVKLKRAAAKTLDRENPRNIPLQKLKAFESVFTKYNVTKVYKPFYQAIDDENLPAILKIEFKKISAVSAFIEDLSRLADVAYAEKVPLMKTDITPNDPTVGAHLTQINAQNAWGVFNGNSNITVAIVDNAVMWTHQDLVANTYTNTGEIPGNNIDDDLNGYIDDVNGWDVGDNDNNAIPTNTLMDHGTHCAGIAGARNDNALGIASIGWNIKIIPVKATANLSSTSSIDDGYGGIVYAANAKARVISCSWGGGGFAMAEQNVIDYAWNKGCIVIAAAGNNNTSTQSYPGAYGNVYCVASVGAGDVKSGFSNYGAWVDISAPGEGIYSTIPNATTGTYGFKSGTSMATPVVAGLAALMLSNCSFMTQTDVLNCISSTAINIYTLTGNGTYSTTNQLGAGRIEAYAAMNCSSGFLTTPPIANFFAFPLNTCPNTPVTFYDSSLYVTPLATRSWTFQSGSPANATTSNVAVQWASAGTYSAALTVSTTNGSHTKPKLAYVTVAGPINLPLVEGFQATPFLPANWTPNNVYNDNIYWSRATGVGGFGTSTACAVFDNYNIDAATERDEMRTPKYIFSNVVSARLRFDVAYARYNSFYTDTLEVKLSTNCGATWTSIYLKGGTALSTRSDLTANTFTPTSGQWRTDSIDITTLAAGQGNVMFSFINRGHYGQALYLDNINLAFPTPTINVTMPSPVCAGANITGTNTSVGAATYTWNTMGGVVTVSNTNAPTFYYLTPGIHSLTIGGSNGTSTTAVTRTLMVLPQPTVSVNTPVICLGNSVTLTASGATSYTWTGYAPGASINVSPATATSYTVTGSDGTCSTNTVSNVGVIAPPVISVNSATICQGNQAVLTPTGTSGTSYTWTTQSATVTTPFITPGLTVTPASTTIYSVTSAIAFCPTTQTTAVYVNANPTITVNNPTICSGSSAVLTPTGATSYTWSTGTSTLFTPAISTSPSVTAIYSLTGSNGLCSAARNTTIIVNPTPTLSALDPTVCSGTTATLNVTGANSYLWNTGANTNSLLISPTTNTSYVVTGTSIGCSSTKTVMVTMEATPNILVVGSQSLICSGATVVLTASGANTYTWSNSLNTGSIGVSPNSTSIYTVNGTNTLCVSSNTISVAVLPLPAITISSAPSATICAGMSTTLTAAGSYSVLTWSGMIPGPTLSVTPVANTTYSVTGVIPNISGCITTSVITIAVNPLPVSFISSTNSSCTNSCSGSAAVVTNTGTAPYTYNMTAAACLSLPCNNLCIGDYTLVTKDALGCSSQATFAISAPLNNMSLTTGSANATCSNCATGTSSVAVSGGLAPYTYTWSPGGSNAAINSGVLPGCYTVSVNDANKCQSQNSVCVGFDFVNGIQTRGVNPGNVSIYPNPAQQQVTIDFEDHSFDYALYNNLGQLIKQKQDNDGRAVLQLDEFAKGVYVVVVRSGNENTILKLVLE